VQTYISGFPMMDLYRTLWETSLDPGRGHDRTLNEYFVFDRLITSEDDWVITPNNDTIYLRAFLDLRAEPVILVIPTMGDRQYWVPVSDMRHDFDAKAYFTTLNQVLRLSPRLGHPMDDAMAGWLREIGMDPATGFAWDQLSPQAQRGLERATADAHRIIAERMPRSVPRVNNWQLARLDKKMRR
jgi:hypothetical protein